jgi:hypothetical protein
MKLRCPLLLIVVASLVDLTMMPAAPRPPQPSGANTRRSFTVYDNIFYRGKPNTAAEGLVPSNILYEAVIWPHNKNYGEPPPREAFASMVREHAANPGPLVIDIERLPVKGSPEVARHNRQILSKLADWARSAAPGKMVGFYGSNTLTRVPPANLGEARILADHVDAMFPPAYTFDDDRAAWADRAEKAAAEARALAPGKPVYFYLWPQYHDNTPKQFQYVDAAYWKFQLETAHRLADGVVLWSPSKFAWDNSSGWWTATREFMHTLRAKP